MKRAINTTDIEKINSDFAPTGVELSNEPSKTHPYPVYCDYINDDNGLKYFWVKGKMAAPYLKFLPKNATSSFSAVATRVILGMNLRTLFITGECILFTNARGLEFFGSLTECAFAIGEALTTWTKGKGGEKYSQYYNGKVVEFDEIFHSYVPSVAQRTSGKVLPLFNADLLWRDHNKFLSH